MTFFPEPLRPSEGRKEDEEIIVNPIEADKKGGEEPIWELPGGKKGNFYASMIVLLKKFTSLFTRQKREEFSEDALAADIHSLTGLLDRLKELDQSENAHFAQELSNLWHELLQHVQLASKAKMKTEVEISKVKIVLSDIDRYPPNEERKLGFYLAEFAGESWLPMPFIEILRKLHDDYKVNKNSSILEKWTDLLKESVEG
ncbi:hypothetical protein [Simkania negevensis]|uniref:Uncharacterized protein n=1 Tax=Simkania negevensis (strain ATCC VR-1471 / DSM 27360 / Z) TaxID=331113 RepID=F8L411_SIMNZ|nr:hypothetical protein [Simkania negevensis]CCB90041.1 unknown protein [Simkania negevensis Z]